MEFLVDDEEVQNERDRGIEQRQKREFERELGVGSVDEDGGWSEMIEDNTVEQIRECGFKRMITVVQPNPTNKKCARQSGA
jgi:hypothetical protein